MNISLLHEELWQPIALCLEAPDILALVQVSRSVNKMLRTSRSFWQILLERDTKGGGSGQHTCIASHAHLRDDATCDDYRRAFLQTSYQRLLPHVHWQALGHNTRVRISGREAHLACVLGTQDEQVLVVTQGFTEDQSVYLKPLSANSDLASASWQQIRPSLRGERQRAWVYGATLTPLSDDPFSAVLMGGFTSGGYTNETSQVAVLRLAKANDEWMATWEIKECTTQSGISVTQLSPARAYHAAQLVLGRYLVVMGGMKARLHGSVLDPAILDTRTWVWLDQVNLGLASTCSDNAVPKIPDGRHGCSLVWDACRERFVLFGGASGRDILRSGQDICDVWELKSRGELPAPLTHDALLRSFPWEWNRIIANQNMSADDALGNRAVNDGDEMQGQGTDMAANGNVSATTLSPAEALCLGRCHAGYQVARDTVMLVFGSANPATNGVLGYDLRHNKFIRPSVTGCLPEGRLCFASAFIPSHGAIWVHSGWSTRLGGEIDQHTDTNMALLQLAPHLSIAHSFGLQASPLPAQPITDEDVRTARRWGLMPAQRLLMSLLVEEDPLEAAGDWLVNRGPWTEQQAILLQMVAQGHMILRQEMDNESEAGDG